jgi:aspartate carbamoyltransferase catalytic subunit
VASPLRHVRRADDGGRLVTDPRTLATIGCVPPSLGRIEGMSVLSVRDVSRDEVLDLFRVSASLQTGAWLRPNALSGLIMLTAFFEPSTRTRLSFESAAHRVGAAVISISDGRVLGVQKGESLADTGVMFNAYADIVIMRHTAECSIHDIRSAGLEVPLVNGGNGCDEHPTQAMVDWYALLKWRPELITTEPPADRRISLGVLGTPRRMRSLRSFLFMGVTHFPNAIRDITVVSEADDPVDTDLQRALERSGLPVVQTSDFEQYVSRFDVIYQNSLTLVGERYQVLDAHIRIDANTRLKDGAVVMHPLARLHELSSEIDDTRHNLYFDQAQGAVFVRQALLLALAGRLDGGPRRAGGSSVSDVNQRALTTKSVPVCPLSQG